MNADQWKVIVNTQHALAVQSIAIQELMRVLPESARASLASALQTKTNEYLETLADVMTPEADRTVTMHLQSLLESIGRAAPPRDASKG